MIGFSADILSFLAGIPVGMQLLVLFVFSFAEGLPVIGSILPGGTIAIFAGTLVEQGVLGSISTVLVIACSSFLGDMTGFLLGKKFKHLQWVRSVTQNEKHQKTWDLFDRHIALITIFGKLIPVVRSTPSIIAGFRNIQSRTYMIYSFAGSLLWSVAGVYAGRLITVYFGKNAIPILIGIIVISVCVVGFRFIFKSKK